MSMRDVRRIKKLVDSTLSNYHRHLLQELGIDRDSHVAVSFDHLQGELVQAIEKIQQEMREFVIFGDEPEHLVHLSFADDDMLALEIESCGDCNRILRDVVPHPEIPDYSEDANLDICPEHAQRYAQWCLENHPVHIAARARHKEESQ